MNYEEEQANELEALESIYVGWVTQSNAVDTRYAKLGFCLIFFRDFERLSDGPPYKVCRATRTDRSIW